MSQAVHFYKKYRYTGQVGTRFSLHPTHFYRTLQRIIKFETMKQRSQIATLLAALSFLPAQAEVREVVMNQDDIVVEEEHLPKRTPPSVLVVPSVTHDTDNQLLIVSVSSPASIRYTLADEQGTIVEEGDATVSKTLCIPTFGCQSGTHTIRIYVQGRCYKGDVYIE